MISVRELAETIRRVFQWDFSPSDRIEPEVSLMKKGHIRRGSLTKVLHSNDKLAVARERRERLFASFCKRDIWPQLQLHCVSRDPICFHHFDGRLAGILQSVSGKLDLVEKSEGPEDADQYAPLGPVGSLPLGAEIALAILLSVSAWMFVECGLNCICSESCLDGPWYLMTTALFFGPTGFVWARWSYYSQCQH